MTPRLILRETVHFTPAAGVEIFVREIRREGEGDGEPVFVLVHGLGMSGRYMMPTALLLAEWGRVYLLDLPGFGRSGKPKRPLSIHGLADAVAECIEDLGISQPVVLGNSLGAQVLADFAARYPLRLRAAVLTAPTADPEARTVPAQLFRLLLDLPREPLALFGIGISDYLRAGWVSILGTMLEALKHPMRETLAAIQAPVLLVCGERDPIMPARWREEAAQLIPRVTSVVLPGVAHALNFSASVALVQAVRQFLEEPPGPHAGAPSGNSLESYP